MKRCSLKNYYLLYFSTLLYCGQLLSQPSFIKPATYYVSQSAAAGGNGTPLQPFQKIADALNTAQRSNRGVTVNISTGIYRESLVITGNTTLHGMTEPATSGRKPKTAILLGSIQNNNPVTLKIENLQIVNAAAPGAVVINNILAKTILNNVTISRATRYGIYQRGGTLRMDTAVILFTSAGIVPVTGKTNKEETVCYGTGIFIKNTVASLVNVKLQLNVQGLVADGSSTIVDITNLLAENHILAMKEYFLCTANNPANGMAAIEVRNGAILRVQGIKILDNEVRGLFVHNGGRFIGTDVIILRTKSVLCANSQKMGGINIAVNNEGARLDITRFEIGYADLCGLQLINAKARLANGNVHHNIIGINIQQQPPDFNFEDLTINVIFKDNERNIDTDILLIPVPDTNLPDF
jgi:hypothetical protein